MSEFLPSYGFFILIAILLLARHLGHGGHGGGDAAKSGAEAADISTEREREGGGQAWSNSAGRP